MEARQLRIRKITYAAWLASAMISGCFMGAAHAGDRNAQSKSESATTRWDAFIDSVRTSPALQRAAAINQYINALPQVSDLRLWGVEDYWASPAEMIAAGGGDCEDFALAKYEALIRSGVPAQRLWLAYSKLLKLNGSIESHMLLVFEDDASRLWALDNFRQLMLPLRARHDLILTTGINAFGVWRFQDAGPPRRVSGRDALPARVLGIVDASLTASSSRLLKNP